MTRIKYTASAALGAALEAAAPALAGNVRILQQPPDRAEAYPAAVILPERFDTEWHWEDEVEDSDGAPVMLDEDGGVALMEVGTLTGSCRIFLAAHYPVEREDLEDAILAAFAAGATPGLLNTAVTVSWSSYGVTYDYPIGFWLDGVDWTEEMAFSERRWAWARCRVDLPILVPKTDAHLIAEYRFCMTQDISTDISGLTPAQILEALAPVEDFGVDENGTITQYEPPGS